MLLGLLLLGGTGHAQTWSGTVQRVIDGDSFRMKSTEGNVWEVRLTEIDAPERGQPHYAQSRAALRALVGGKPVVVTTRGVDHHGRTLGRVMQGPVDVNARMVQRGMAWANVPHLTDQRFILWEKEARRQRIGLWALDAAQQIPPWDQRAADRKPDAGAADRSSAPRSAGARPGVVDPTRCAKRLCRQMASCAEATFYLRQCGVRGLDRNGDGIPCETSVCRSGNR